MGELFKIHQACYSGFASLVALIRSPKRDFSSQVSQRDWEVEIERYKIWGHSVGAGYYGDRYEKSLDYRLRDAPFMGSQVALMMNLVVQNLENATALLKAERVPWEDLTLNLSERNKSAPDRELPQDEQGGSYDDDDSPWDSSSNGGSSNEITSTADEYRNAGPGEASTVTMLHTKDFQVARVMYGEMTQIRDAIHTTISTLYRLPVRKAALQDRLRGKLPDEVATFENLDIAYTRYKFPELTKYCPEVATRLGKLITRRREILHFRRTREYRKSHPSHIQETTSTKSPIAGTVGSDDLESGLATDTLISVAMTEIAPHSAYTRATTYQENPNNAAQNALWLETPGYASSVYSAPASDFATQTLHVRIPQRPLRLDGEELENFICPYCCIAVEMRSEKQWKHHVLQDLQPYVCTYPDCELGDFLFETRAQWFHHELSKHRAHWYCNTKGHKTFTVEADFREHMAVDHAHEYKTDEVKLLTASGVFTTPSEATREGFCMLCRQDSARPEGHVGRHLEILALLVIPAEDFPEESDGEQSDIEGRKIARQVKRKHSKYRDDSFYGDAHLSREYLEAMTEEEWRLPVDDNLYQAFQTPDTSHTSNTSPPDAEVEWGKILDGVWGNQASTEGYSQIETSSSEFERSEGLNSEDSSSYFSHSTSSSGFHSDDSGSPANGNPPPRRYRR